MMLNGLIPPSISQYLQVAYLSSFTSLFSLVIVFSCVFINTSYAKDIIKINKGRSVKDIRTQYNFDILHKAMEVTEPEFGEYELNVVSRGIPAIRLRQMITKGDVINLAMVVSTPEWEAAATPIRIPLRLGILNYRLLLINKNKVNSFADVNSIEQLKKKSVGLRRHWATWQTMTKLGYNVVNAYSYEAIFAMLDRDRFDYIPRGIHEIYDEIDMRKNELTNLMVEPHLALHIPAPFYVFISPNEPRLIKRFELGLNRLAKQGYLKEMLNKHYAGFLKKADLKNRLILEVGNPDLSPETPFNQKELWMSWD